MDDIFCNLNIDSVLRQFKRTGIQKYTYLYKHTQTFTRKTGHFVTISLFGERELEYKLLGLRG